MDKKYYICEIYLCCKYFNGKLGTFQFINCLMNAIKVCALYRFKFMNFLMGL